MPKYSRETIEAVMAAVDIVDVIGSRLELKAAGAGRLKALCPFHREKTPSFTVNRVRQMFHCFGCGKGGDALGFLMEHDGLSFQEALQYLADRGGVQLPALAKEDRGDDFLRTQLLEFNCFTAAFHRTMFDEPSLGARAREYLASRQLNPETIRRFGLGAAPEGYTHLYDAARGKGYPIKLLEASGLFKQGEHGRYDLFRNRLMFPIKDIAGNIVAFGGRELGDGPAKYINSPENSLYKKSRVLYALHEARDTLRKEKRALLMEGYFDVLRCFDVGIESAVATCGTALTEAQANLLRRYTKRVVLVYDGDAAGVKAALKATGILVAAGLEVRALTLPDGQDPDEYIRAAGRAAFLERVDGAPDFLSYCIAMNQQRLDSIEGRTAVAHELFEILRGIEDTLRVDEYLKAMAEQIGLHEWACRKEYTQFLRQSKRREESWRGAPMESSAPKPISRDDCQFITALIEQPDLQDKVRDRLNGLRLKAAPLIELLHCLLHGEGEVYTRLKSAEAKRLYTAAVNLEEAYQGDIEELVDKRLNALQCEALANTIARMEQEITEAERNQDVQRALALTQDRMRVLRQLKEVRFSS